MVGSGVVLLNPDAEERPRSSVTRTMGVGCSVTRFRRWRAKAGGVTRGKFKEGVSVAFLRWRRQGEAKGGDPTVGHHVEEGKGDKLGAWQSGDGGR
jgi:hypothetical protein